MAFAPTAQQSAFLNALTSTSSNLALVARAGCGKTSTILMAVDAVAARLRDGGTLVVGVPNRQSLQARLARARRARSGLRSARRSASCRAR